MEAINIIAIDPTAKVIMCRTIVKVTKETLDIGAIDFDLKHGPRCSAHRGRTYIFLSYDSRHKLTYYRRATSIEIGRKIAEFRRTKNLTQKESAEELRICKSYLKRLKRDIISGHMSKYWR